MSIASRGGKAAGVVAAIPAFQAEATVGRVVEGALRHLPRVLVIDDGSTDETSARADAAGAEVIRHEENRGKGAALRTAFARLLGERPARGAAVSGFEAALTLDADGQHDPDDIPLFLDLRRRRGAALIVGSRARHFETMWGPRRLMNRFSSAWLRLVAGIDLEDTQSGFRLYEARLLERLSLGGARYEVEMEALLQAAALGERIAALDIRLGFVDGRSTSHFRAFTDTFRIIGTALAHRARRRPQPAAGRGGG